MYESMHLADPKSASLATSNSDVFDSVHSRTFCVCMNSVKQCSASDTMHLGLDVPVHNILLMNVSARPSNIATELEAMLQRHV